MKVRIAFTLDIEKDDVPQVREFMQAMDVQDLRGALNAEARDYLVGYLEDNVATVKVVGEE